MIPAFTQSHHPIWVRCSQLSSHLEALVLSHNRITENAGKVLGPAISENTSLRELDLSWNLIRGRGTKQFADGVGVRSLPATLPYHFAEKFLQKI